MVKLPVLVTPSVLASSGCFGAAGAAPGRRSCFIMVPPPKLTPNRYVRYPIASILGARGADFGGPVEPQIQPVASYFVEDLRQLIPRLAREVGINTHKELSKHRARLCL